MRNLMLVCPVGLALLSGCIVIPIGDLLKTPPLEEQTIAQGRGFFAREKIAVLELNGFIGDGGEGLLWTQKDTVGELRSRLKKIRSDRQVKAVVLRISSAGGEVTASDMIYNDLLRFKEETKIPLVASIVEHGASGAYYIAMAADRVLAHPTAIVGSIGVMMQSYNLAELLGKIGVEVAPVKSADHKDLGSPFRQMSESERAVLQRVVDDLHERFVSVVKRGRPGMSGEQVETIADGRVVSGEAAVGAGLVDGTGYFTDAIEAARELGGISSPTIIHYTRAGAGTSFFSSYGGPPASGAAAAPVDDFELHVRARHGSSPRFLYLWQPGL
jgi:protease-4